MDNKAYIRQQMIQRRQQLPLKKKMLYESIIIEQARWIIGDAKKIGIYAAFNGEVDTFDLIDEWLWDDFRVIGLPKIKPNQHLEFCSITSFKDLVLNSCGILEPITNETIPKQDFDVVVVPIIAFDQNKQRIGFGMGYYDRYLASISAKKIGLAFSFQEVSDIMIHSNDIPLDIIITEKAIIA